MIGTNVTLSCKTRGGTQAFWTLNRTAITVSHESAKQYYENIGVLFTRTESNEYYNLTMVAPAVLAMNNTSISCAARGSGVQMSNEVHMIVFDHFGELQ